jgi:predicted nucleic acid-binding protein
MSVMVDSNVLLDILDDENAPALPSASDNDRLIVNPIICGAVSIRYRGGARRSPARGDFRA